MLLVDGDAGLRSLDLMLGVGQDIVFDLSDIFAGNCEPMRAVYPSGYNPNLALLPAPVSLEGLCSPRDLRRLVKGFSRYYDFILIDCPAGTGRGFETAVGAADNALVVTTPDPVCARDAAVVGDLLAARGVSARLVINRLRPRLVMRGKLPDIDEIIDTAGIRLIGVVPEDDAIPFAAAAGDRLPAACPAARCLRNIASRLCGDPVLLAPLEKM